MTTNTNPAKYDGVLISLHWIIAAAVIANVAIGLIMGDIPRGTPLRVTAYVTHMSIGMSILILSVVLVIWRLTHKTPSLPDTMQPQLKLAARATQFILYAAILILPLLGWAMVSANGKSGPPYFGLFTWPALPFFTDMTKEGQHAAHELFETGHVYLAWTAIVLVSLHILGALYHQFVARDGVLQRILPGGR